MCESALTDSVTRKSWRNPGGRVAASQVRDVMPVSNVTVTFATSFYLIIRQQIVGTTNVLSINCLMTINVTFRLLLNFELFDGLCENTDSCRQAASSALC